MRVAAIASGWFLAAAATAAVGQPVPAVEAPSHAPNAPPYPGTAQPQADPAFATALPGTSPHTPGEGRARVSPGAPSAAGPASKGHAETARTAHGRPCFSQAEARDKIAQRRLADPARAMRAGRAEGEALRTRLCRWRGDDLVYEIWVLRRDGHVVRLYMNAQNGESVSAADAAEHR